MAGEKEQLVRFLDILDQAYMSENYERAQEAAGSPKTPPKHRHRTDVPRTSKRAPTKEVVPR